MKYSSAVAAPRAGNLETGLLPRFSAATGAQGALQAWSHRQSILLGARASSPRSDEAEQCGQDGGNCQTGRSRNAPRSVGSQRTMRAGRPLGTSTCSPQADEVGRYEQDARAPRQGSDGASRPSLPSAAPQAHQSMVGQAPRNAHLNYLTSNFGTLFIKEPSGFGASRTRRAPRSH